MSWWKPKQPDWEVVVMIAVMLGLGALMLLVMFAGAKTATVLF